MVWLINETRGITKCLYLHLALQDLSILYIHFIYIFLTQKFFFVFGDPVKYGQQTNNFLSPA